MSRLTLAQANRIIETALGTARQRGHRPMGIVVLDEAGQVRAVQREDGASEFLGAVGASGGTGGEDEAICMAGVEAAGLQHA